MRARIQRSAAALAVVALAVSGGGLTVAHAAPPNVLLVCPTGPNDGPGTAGPHLACPAGAYSSIQTAVSAAAAGDWILIAPGVYHEKGATGEGVHVATPGLHIRGMDRNGVVVDGTNVNSHGPCSSNAADQDTGGRNGIVVHKVNGVAIENLTTCNYLLGSNGEGNEIWWNGGDGSGQIHMGSYLGNYITGTATYFSPAHMGKYGIFVSNANGPGIISNAYAANMGDSAFYVGACPDCNAILDNVHAENSALGYSGTNAGGHLTIKNSEWDLNKAGIVPNSLNNDDAPPPQDGRCPGTTTSCTLIVNNKVHDNNNPNVPSAGIAGAAPIGTGIELSGASYNTVDSNLVYNQSGWGIAVHDYPDTETPPSSGVSHCQGGVATGTGPTYVCTFRSVGNNVLRNKFHDNGGFGNPSNGDLALESTVASPGNCFSGNTHTDSAALSSDPPAIETVDGPPQCNTADTGESTVLLAELVCASGAVLPASCPNVPAGQPGYPQTTTIAVLPLSGQTTMPNPCKGVPDNAWCSGGQLVGSAVVPESPLVLLIPLAAAVGFTVYRGRRRRGAAAA